jgi:hypothetical protein
MSAASVQEYLYANLSRSEILQHNHAMSLNTCKKFQPFLICSPWSSSKLFFFNDQLRKCLTTEKKTVFICQCPDKALPVGYPTLPKRRTQSEGEWKTVTCQTQELYGGHTVRRVQIQWGEDDRRWRGRCKEEDTTFVSEHVKFEALSNIQKKK